MQGEGARGARGYLSDLLAFAIHRRAQVEREVLEAGGGARQGSGRLQRRGPQTTPSLWRDSDAMVKGWRSRAQAPLEAEDPCLPQASPQERPRLGLWAVPLQKQRNEPMWLPKVLTLMCTQHPWLSSPSSLQRASHHPGLREWFTPQIRA